jgi:hypothetical protein
MGEALVLAGEDFLALYISEIRKAGKTPTNLLFRMPRACPVVPHARHLLQALKRRISFSPFL